MSLADELLADLEENDAPEDEIMDTDDAEDADEHVFVKPAIPLKIEAGKHFFTNVFFNS